MAQLQRPEKVDECTQETTQFETKDVSKTSNKNNKEDTASFKFNVQAPEFVPRSHTTTTPISSYFYPYFQYLSGGTAASDWLYVGDQDTISYVSNQSFSAVGQSQKDVLPEEVKNKIIKQVIAFSFLVIFHFLIGVALLLTWSYITFFFPLNLAL